MEDTLPIKFRSPPAKPPRRRHSDQLSVSSSGTFPSNRKKLYDENQHQQNTENSISSCGSLPSNWTTDFSLENKLENIPMCKDQECLSTHAKNSHDFSIKDIVFNNYKYNLENSKFCESKSFLNHSASSCNPPYIHHIVTNDILATDHNSTKFLKHLDVDFSKISTKIISSTELTNIKSFNKDCHRRHNSDPLPSNFNIDKNSFLQSLSNNNELYNLDYPCEQKENQFLLLEIKSLKEINRKLWEYLCSLQTSLEKLRRSSNETSSGLSVSDLLSSVYDSLKSKDSAMEDRMRMVLQERDNAIQDLDCMIQVLAKSFEDNSCDEAKPSDKELQELLKEIEVTSNPSKLLQQQRLLLLHLYRSKELKQDWMLHEIKITTAERDNLRVKIKVLEDELNCLKTSNDIKNTDNKFWENSLLSALCQVIQQRDVAMKNYNIQSNMDYFNSRSSICEKSFDSDVINDCLQRLDGAVIRKKSLQLPQNESRKYSPFTLKSKSDEVRYLKEEILLLNKSLEVEIEKRENAEEKCVRLERLVNVLQKKINGQMVGIPV